VKSGKVLDKVGERVYLETLNTDFSLQAVLTVELLSTHAGNEVYLGDPNNKYIVVCPLCPLNTFTHAHHAVCRGGPNHVTQALSTCREEPTVATSAGLHLPYPFAIAALLSPSPSPAPAADCRSYHLAPWQPPSDFGIPYP
jgi:hypothetical protein